MSWIRRLQETAYGVARFVRQRFGADTVPRCRGARGRGCMRPANPRTGACPMHELPPSEHRRTDWTPPPLGKRQAKGFGSKDSKGIPT